MTGAPIRVLFLFERPESWINVHGLWALMRDDPRFDPHVWLVPAAGLEPGAQRGQTDRCLSVARERGVSVVQWRDGDPTLSAGMFDVAVFNTPYDAHRPAELYFDCVARKVPHTVYIPYGIVTGGGSKNLWLQYAQPAQRRAELVVARSQMEKRAYRRHCPGGDRRVAVLGLPRMDQMHGIQHFAVDPALRDRIGGRLAILWNSHYGFPLRHADSSNYSTFDRMAIGLFGYAARTPGVALIWRPHPHLFLELVGSGVFAEAELAAFRGEIADLGVILDERPDHRHGFAASHALLTDAGSFLIEYLVTGNPVLYLRNPDGEVLNEEAEALLMHYDVAESDSEAMAFIDDLLLRGDLRRDERLGARPVFLPLFDGRASERVADRIAQLCAGARRDGVDASSFPLVGRLDSALRQLQDQKRRRLTTSGGLRHKVQGARRWMVNQIKQDPSLLRAASAVLGRLGRRRTSPG